MPRYQVVGNEFACQFCQGAEFAERKVKLNTGAMSFFDLDWLSKSADGLICENCGYLHMFFKKDVVQPI